MIQLQFANLNIKEPLINRGFVIPAQAGVADLIRGFLITCVLVVLWVVNTIVEFYMASTQQKVHDIIHAASVASAKADAGLAQAPGSDQEAIVPIQTGMILEIASAHGKEITEAAAAELLSTLAATARNRQVHLSRQAMTGWLPGIDNTNNESTAAALTEAIGWAANSHFGQTETKT